MCIRQLLTSCPSRQQGTVSKSARQWLIESGCAVPPLLNEALVTFVRKLLEATWRLNCRSKAADFTRGGPLTPELLVTLPRFVAADAGRRGYGQMLDAFWEEADRSGIALASRGSVSAAAFCKARCKLKPQLLAALLAMFGAEVDRLHGRPFLWHGQRFFAVDGMRHPCNEDPSWPSTSTSRAAVSARKCWCRCATTSSVASHLPRPTHLRPRASGKSCASCSRT
jgi:hypothetical protein